MAQKNMPKCDSECLDFLYCKKSLENYREETKNLENAKNICITNISFWSETCGNLQKKAKTSIMEVSRKEAEAYKTMLKLVNNRINEINKEFGK